MDIMDEIDETIEDKKRKWNYVPMREKSETDALIDELLNEFSSAVKPETLYPDDYRKIKESEERRRYENSVKDFDKVYEDESTQNNDSTQIYSREEIAGAEAYDEENYYNMSGSMSDSGNGNNDDDDYNIFDDDYYDEEDFDEDCENLEPEKLDLNDEEYAEFENYMYAKKEEKIRKKKQKTKRENKIIAKKGWRIIYTAVIAAFTIIGMFSSFIYILEQMQLSPADVKNKEEQLKTELCNAVYPAVEVMIDDFDGVENITAEDIIKTSVMEILIKSDMKYFRNPDTDRIEIPHTQIETAASNIFGIKEKTEPADTAIGSLEIKYDKASDCYIIPDEYYLYTQYPVVKTVDESGTTYTVTVECYNDYPEWVKNKKIAPAKKMRFVLEKKFDYYNIVSAKTIS